MIKDDGIISAVQEERFTRNKHDHTFPAHAIQYCLQEAGINISELRHVAFYEKQFLKFEQIVALCRLHPDLVEINKNIRQKKGKPISLKKS